MIEGQWTDQVGRTRKSHNANTIIRAFIDELGYDRLDDIDAVDALTANLEVQCLHGTGDIQSQHDIDTARGHIRAPVGESWSSHPDDHQGRRHDRKQPSPAPGAASGAARNRASDLDIGVFDGGYTPLAAAP